MNEFWKQKSLSEMDPQEWESLCDGCARCCLHKLEDEDNGEIHYTRVACRHLNLDNCRCTCYGERDRIVKECIVLDAEHTGTFAWLPESCAYRRIAEGKSLPSWHPLLSRRSDSVTKAGISACLFAIGESDEIPLEEHMITFSDPVEE